MRIFAGSPGHPNCWPALALASGISLVNTLGQFGGIVGNIKDMTGNTTPALYVIGVTSVIAAGLLLWALPEKLRSLDKSHD